MSVVTELDCHKIIANYSRWNSRDVELKSFHISPLSDKNAGFFGTHLKLTINLKYGEENFENLKPIKAFVKSMPTSPDHKKYVEELSAFNKEHQNFDRLLPSMQNISKQHNIKWSPWCYLSKNDLLVFEDLSEDGYQMIEDSKLMDFEHLKVAARTLGYFHSASYIFETVSLDYGKPSIKEAFPYSVKENSYVTDPNNVRYHWFDCGIKIIVKMIRELNKYNEEEISQIEKQIFSKREVLKGFFRPSENKVNVLCHGDLWVNNFMFKYDKNGSPSDCCLVDFQLTRYASGVLDYTCMLYLCSDKTTRDEYRDKVLAAYEQAFNEQIKKSGIKSPKIDFKEDFKFFKPAAMVEALLFEMITRLDEEALQQCEVQRDDFFYGDRSLITMPAFERSAAYRNRLTELIEEFIQDYIFLVD